MDEPIGPNVRKLIAHKMSLDAVPAGGGFAAALDFLSRKENITASAKSAKDWVRTALRAVREAAAPNPWALSTDEEIAGYLLEKIAERQSAAPKEQMVIVNISIYNHGRPRLVGLSSQSNEVKNGNSR